MIVKCIRNQVLRLPIEIEREALRCVLTRTRIHIVLIRLMRFHAVGIVFTSDNSIFFPRINNRKTLFNDL